MARGVTDDRSNARRTPKTAPPTNVAGIRRGLGRQPERTHSQPFLATILAPRRFTQREPRLNARLAQLFLMLAWRAGRGWRPRRSPLNSSVLHSTRRSWSFTSSASFSAAAQAASSDSWNPRRAWPRTSFRLFRFRSFEVRKDAPGKPLPDQIVAVLADRVAGGSELGGPCPRAESSGGCRSEPAACSSRPAVSGLRARGSSGNRSRAATSVCISAEIRPSSKFSGVIRPTSFAQMLRESGESVASRSSKPSRRLSSSQNSGPSDWSQRIPESHSSTRSGGSFTGERRNLSTRILVRLGLRSQPFVDRRAVREIDQLVDQRGELVVGEILDHVGAGLPAGRARQGDAGGQSDEPGFDRGRPGQPAESGRIRARSSQ